MLPSLGQASCRIFLATPSLYLYKFKLILGELRDGARNFAYGGPTKLYAGWRGPYELIWIDLEIK
jgi:hypothetical protein